VVFVTWEVAMAKHTGSKATRSRRSAASNEWPISDEPAHALDDPDVGVDPTAFYRWRRVRSEPPPPMGPSGSGLSHYRRRDRDA
jgi:hypothetical protein